MRVGRVGGGLGLLQVLIAERSAGSALHCRAAESQIPPPPPVGRRLTRSNPEGNQLWLLFLRRRILVSVFAGESATATDAH